MRFTTPAFVEATEVCGPIALKLFASSTVQEILWFVSLLEIDERGAERLLTRGWLRGTHRALDEELSRPYQPYHPHTGREPLDVNRIYEFDIEVRPYAIRMRPGTRLALRVKSVDDEKPANALQAIAMGHVWSPESSRVSVYHDGDHPSALLLPIVRGNRIGTFMSGGLQEPPG